MRRKDREVTGLAELTDILDRCTTLRLGLSRDGSPYIVPVSFGWEIQSGILVLYFHSAGAGEKHRLLSQNDQVTVEADIFHRYEDLTARYESFMGRGQVSLLSGPEKIHALEQLNLHCGFSDYPVESCGDLSRTAVYRITVTECTGKRSLG